MRHGWIILDKPYGLGSTQAVSAVKRALRAAGEAKTKVGHGGTLDPLASGVLPIALGEATKLSGRMLDASKDYEFTIGFGVETDTLDTEGVAVARSDVRPTRAAVEAVLPRFTGPIEQVPPAYSALKVDGQRAYDRARAGEAVALAARQVEVFALELVEAADTEHQAAPLPLGGGGGVETAISANATLTIKPQTHPTPSPEGEGSVTLRASVSKGTYIRALARDIAHALGTVGHVTMLRRTRAGPFGLDQAMPVERLSLWAAEAPITVLPVDAAWDGPRLSLSAQEAQRLRHGQNLVPPPGMVGTALAVCERIPVALVDIGDQLRVIRGFNLD